MTVFKFTELVSGQPADVVSTALGASSGAKLVQADIGKPVKLAGSQNYVVCAATNEIEGFVSSVEPSTVNDGFSFGAVLRNTRVTAKVVGSTLAVGALVCAATPSSLGTNDPYPLVQAGSPSTFKWRVLSLVDGSGAAGHLVLLERI